MMGLDCLWKPDFSDSELLRISTVEKRHLLTRDRALFRRADPEFSCYVQSVYPKEQLEEVIKKFQLGKWIRKGDYFLSRCLECNTSIALLQPDQAPESLPKNVKLHHTEFFTCPTCKRIYWKGSHFYRMKGWLNKIADVDPDA